MKKSLFLPLCLLCGGLALTGCNDDDDNPGTPSTTGNGKTLYVVNEGNFGTPNAAITRQDLTTREVTRDLFNAVNGYALGDQAQSMTVAYGNHGYIVLGGSGSLQTVDVA